MFRYQVLGIAVALVATSAELADLLWGASGHPLTAYPGVTIEKQFDYLEDLGVKSYRVNIVNLSMAGQLEKLVSEGKKRGIEILPVITPDNIDLEKDDAGKLYEKAHEFAVGLGTQFKHDIRAWELGNEMENYALINSCEKRDDGTQYPCEWGLAGGTNVLDYFGPRWAKVSAVLKGLSQGFIDVDPSIRKAIGTAGWGHTGAFERMKSDGIQWDISVWHMYGEDPTPAFKLLSAYGKPIWVTEFNNPYGSHKGEYQQAEGLIATMKQLRELQGQYNVESAHIYELLDEPYWAPGFEASMGLVRVVGSAESGWRIVGPKPAYVAARALIRGPRQLPKPERLCDLATKAAPTTSAVGTVDFAYCLILGRAPQAEESELGLEALASDGSGLPMLAVGLMRSSEFNSRYAPIGLSDRSYISFLYRLLVDRDADEYGLDTYSRQLREGAITREDVALGMMTSGEFQAKHSLIAQQDSGTATR